MKFLYLITAVFLMSLLSCTSCNGNTTETDSDKSENPDIVNDQDSLSEEENDLISDSDSFDADLSEESPDIDNAECLPAHIDAGYPYYRKDGTIHFCRECDKPTNNDPDCIANLWVDGNKKLFAEHPDKDCLGYPCMMNDLTPFYSGEREGYYLDKCDMMINANNPKGWQTGMVTFKHYNLSEGKVGFFIYHVLTKDTKEPIFKAVEFDIEKRSYQFVRPSTANNTLSYYKGAFFNTVWDEGINEPSMQYLVYSDSSGKMKVVYNKPVYFIVYNPKISDKWVFVNIREVEGGPSEMKYAKIGEWKWRKLGDGIGNDPRIYGDKLVLFTDTFEGYLCDLSKSPEKLESCLRINRGDEEIRRPKIDSENNDIVYFSPVDMVDGFMKLDLSKNPVEYSEIKLDGLLEPRFSVAVQEAKGKMIMYSDIFVSNTESGDRDFRICFYRTDMKKSFCSLATPHAEGKMEYRQSAPEYEGHWLVWQDSVGPLMKVRDMECYCDYHPELCPFNDYTPQPDNPKDVKTGKRPSDEPKK